MICARVKKSAKTSPNPEAHSSQRSEEFCFLILIDPFQIEQEIDRGIKRIEQIDDRGAMMFVSGKFKLGRDQTTRHW